jgi:hypothetical protein
MKRYLILFLMMVGVCWPTAYTYYVGGASANASNPYFHESSVTAAQCIGAAGAAIYTADDAAAGACSTADAGARTTITVTDTLPTIIAGTYAFIDFAASYTDGYYRINASDIGAKTITIDCTYIDTSDVDAIRIGGAKPATATVLDAVFSATNDYNVSAGTASSLNWTTNSITVKISGSSIGLDGTWDIVGTATRIGAIGDFVEVEACNSSWVPAVGSVTFIPSADLSTVGMCYFANASSTTYYMTLRGFIFDGTDGVNTAKYGIQCNGTATNTNLDQITCHSTIAGGAGFAIKGGAATYVTRCVAYSNAGAGFYTTTNATGANYELCVARDNGGDGFDLQGARVLSVSFQRRRWG